MSEAHQTILRRMQEKNILMNFFEELMCRGRWVTMFEQMRLKMKLDGSKGLNGRRVFEHKLFLLYYIKNHPDVRSI